MRGADTLRWCAYGLLTAALAAAATLRGGVYAQQWQWIALLISIAALLCAGSAKDRPREGDRICAILLGALLVSGFLHAAMARGARRTPTARPAPRVTFYLSVDEFQNFATDSFGEDRALRLRLVRGLAV